MPTNQVADFIRQYDIDLDAVKRMLKRVFVVGRFNKSGSADDPGIYLFTNRTISDEYRKNFTAVADLRYGDFVQILRPAIAELIDESGRFPRVEQVVPQVKDSLAGTAVIDVWHWFFVRAVANSLQPEFQGKGPQGEREMLPSNDKEKGKSILLQIRENLETFCDFQPDTYEVINAMSVLMGHCGNEHDLPPYAEGGALPPAFPERLIDFLYAEDPRRPFRLKTEDLARLGDGPWAKLARSDGARKTFESVVSAFRDTLLQTGKTQYNGVRFKGHPLSQLADDSVPLQLRERFQAARNAFNGLRQILRSKTLLSMVLEWLLSSYYELECVDPTASQADQDDTVETTILDETKAKQFGVKEPIIRPSEKERTKFADGLAKNFEKIMAAIASSEDNLTEALADLNEEFHDLVRSRRGEAKVLQALKTISAADDPQMHKAFLEASRIVLLDVLCPRLYQEPTLTVQDVKEIFQSEVMAAYLSAVFLGDESQDAVKKIADEHIEEFQKHIEKASQKILDPEVMQAVLLENFLDVLTSKEMVRRLSEGIRVLRDVMALQKHADMHVGRGAADISSLDADPDMVNAEGKKARCSAMQKTEPDHEIVRVGTEQLVRSRVRQSEAVESLLERSKAEPAAAAAESGSTSAVAVATEPSNGDDDTASTAEDTSRSRDTEKQNRVSDVERTIDDKICVIVEKMKTDEDQEYSEEDVVEAVSESLLSDEAYVGGLASDVRAFERTLHLIYTRYRENPALGTFRNKVERMTLSNMMLLFQKDLGLGRVCSNLYKLLLDLVADLDPKNPDPAAFIAKNSLTAYFDDAVLRNGGITDLRQTLEVQGARSLQNMVDFVSELRGIHYLMGRVADDPDAEVIVINLSADEFLNWVKKDSLTPATGGGRLRSGRLVRSDSAKCIAPGLVYMTDTAFPSGSKGAWLEGLSSFELMGRDLSVLLPPICLSTAAQDREGLWYAEGRNLNEAASRAPGPIVIVGPSPHLNPIGDGFPTVLPAGYLMLAHFLSAPEQRIVIDNVAEDEGEGRFRVIGFGAAPMRQSLDRVLCGQNGVSETHAGYAFSADYYLHVILTLVATAARYGGRQRPNANLYRYFYYDPDDVAAGNNFKKSTAIDQLLPGGNALQIGIQEDPARERIETVVICPDDEKTLMDHEAPRIEVKAKWFDRARQKAGLP